MTVYDKAIAFITGRATAYRLTFNDEQPADKLVQEDLARFCRANETCVVPGDPVATAILEGRREVWLRIQQHRNLTPEQLFRLYGGIASNNGE